MFSDHNRIKLEISNIENVDVIAISIRLRDSKKILRKQRA